MKFMKIKYFLPAVFSFLLFGCPSIFATNFSAENWYYKYANINSPNRKFAVWFNSDNSLYITSDSAANKDTLTTPVVRPVKSGYNIFYAELFGNGFFSSLNYERVVSKYFSIRLAMAIIFSSSSSNSGSHTDFGVFPFMMVNFLLNIHGNNYFEFGAGSFVFFEAFFPDFAIGYRYSVKEGGFFFSLTFDIVSVTENKMIPWGGIGVGFSF